MMRFLSRHWIWMTVLATASVYAPLAGRSGDERARQRTLETLTEVMGTLQKQAVEPPTAKQLTHAALQGMLHTLDPHSNYMDENEFRTMREDQRGSFFGIGAIIQQQPDGIVIVSTVRGGPSEKAGIRGGDYIKEIDGKSTEGFTSNQAVQKLRGDKGTLVEVTLQRTGFPEPLKFSLTRGEIPTNSVYATFMLNPTTGYILIKDFGEATSDEFEKAVLALKGQGMKELVLDLRNNGGGVMDSAVGICRQLLGPGELIVIQKGRDGRDAIETRSPRGSMLDPLPLVILVNRGSASASEIVTGAIQDHDRGLVVGTTSWGKGLVQSVLAINRTRGLALTTARYYTPSGRSIQRDYTHGLDDYYNPEDAQDDGLRGPEFKTDLGRSVYGGGGITPDYKVEASKLGPFAATLRFRTAAFFKYAVVEKEKFGIKPGQVADEVVMARFQDWLKLQNIPVSDLEWKENLEDLRDLLSYEMQNIAFGVEGGLKHLAVKDPQVKKALEVMAEAAGLLKKKVLSQQMDGKTVIAHKYD
jgi:carboxyl-terminal processing protease